MASLICRAISVAVLVAVSCPAFDAKGESNQPTALEIAQLPKFCWAGLQVPNATGDEFRIRDCGPFVNHYCFGLLRLIRAKAGVGNKRARMDHLSQAANDIGYTQNGIQNYPRCSISEHVAAAKAEVLNLQKIYGGQPSGAK